MWFKHSILIPHCSGIFKPSFKHSHHNHHHSESSLLVIHCLVSPGFGLLITLSSLSISFRIITALSVRVSASSSQSHLHHYHSWYCIHCLVSPGLGLLYALYCSIDPSGYGYYQTDKIYNIIHSFTLVILSMHRKGSAKCALQFINFDIDTNKQYSEKVQSLKFVYWSQWEWLHWIQQTSSLLMASFISRLLIGRELCTSV